MAQSGYTPIQLYYSTTAAAVPVNTNLASGELALNIQDEKLYFKNAAGTVKLLASNATSAPVTSFSAGTTGFTPSTATTGAVTLAGTLATTNGGTNLTSFTSGGVVYASSTSALATGSALTFDGSNLSTTGQILLNNNNYVGFKNTSGSPSVSIFNDTSNFLNFYNSGNTGTIFYVNAAEQMRLTSTGLGIGTSLPSNKLTVDINSASQSTGITLQNSNTGGYGTVFNSALYGYAGSPAAMYNVLSMRTLYSGTTGYVDFYTKVQPQSTEVLALSLQGNGNVGIGTSTATAKLTVINTADANKQIVFGDSATYYGSVGHNSGTGLNEYRTENSGGHGFFIGTSGTANMTLNSSGNLLVGTTASNYRLNVRGAGSVGDSSVYAQFTTLDTGTANSDGFVIGVGTGSSPNANIIQQENAAMVFFTNATERARISAAGGFSVGTAADPGAGAIYATGNITAYYSDARLKTVSGKIENALDKVAQLSGVYYTNNSVAKSFGYDSDEVQVGVLAQDVEAVLPQIVKAAPFDLDENNNSKSGENYKTVQYERLVPLLIEAINELRAEVKALKGA